MNNSEKSIKINVMSFLMFILIHYCLILFEDDIITHMMIFFARGKFDDREIFHTITIFIKVMKDCF